jgi:hypothetical protein
VGKAEEEGNEGQSSMMMAMTGMMLLEAKQ